MRPAFGMGTGFALVLRFCGTLGYGFIGGAGFGGGTGNGVRFGDGNGGCDGRSGKGGGGLESYRRFNFGLRKRLCVFVEEVVTADDKEGVGKRVFKNCFQGKIAVERIIVKGCGTIMTAGHIDCRRSETWVSVQRLEVAAAKADILFECGKAVRNHIADGKSNRKILSIGGCIKFLRQALCQFILGVIVPTVVGFQFGNGFIEDAGVMFFEFNIILRHVWFLLSGSVLVP